MYHCDAVDAPCAVACQEPGVSLLGLSNCNHLNPPWVCTGNPDDTSTGDAWRALLHTETPLCELFVGVFVLCHGV